MTETPPPTTLSTPSPTEHDAYKQIHESQIPSAAALQEMNTLKPTRPLYMIVATATSPPLGIGLKGQLPWPQIKGDMAFFRKATTGKPVSPSSSKLNAVIMGRKTYDSIPPKFRPLSNRVNIILTRNQVRSYADKVLQELTSGRGSDEPAEYRLVDQATVHGLDREVVSIVKRDHEQPTVVVTNSVREAVDVDARDVFCIGGAEVYGLMLEESKEEVRVLETCVRRLDGEAFECDTFWSLEMGEASGWRSVGPEEVEGWVGCELPQGREEWVKDEKAGVEFRTVGWQRERRM